MLYLKKQNKAQNRRIIQNDSGMGRSLLEMSNLITNQKCIWPLLCKYEGSKSNKTEMIVLRKYRSLLSRKRLKKICKAPQDLFSVQKFDLNFHQRNDGVLTVYLLNVYVQIYIKVVSKFSKQSH